MKTFSLVIFSLVCFFHICGFAKIVSFVEMEQSIHRAHDKLSKNMDNYCYCRNDLSTTLVQWKKLHDLHQKTQKAMTICQKTKRYPVSIQESLQQLRDEVNFYLFDDEINHQLILSLSQIDMQDIEQEKKDVIGLFLFFCEANHSLLSKEDLQIVVDIKNRDFTNLTRELLEERKKETDKYFGFLYHNTQESGFIPCGKNSVGAGGGVAKDGDKIVTDGYGYYTYESDDGSVKFEGKGSVESDSSGNIEYKGDVNVEYNW